MVSVREEGVGGKRRWVEDKWWVWMLTMGVTRRLTGKLVSTWAVGKENIQLQ